MKISIKILSLIMLVMVITGCANMAQGPTGGVKDIMSPSFKQSTPQPNSRSVQDNRIEIEFDEYLQINNSSENLVVSPPQKKPVSAKVIGKKVIVELKDSLHANTTYTLDFNNCIGDYTENNLVKDFCYTFSTGETLDTLVMSGIVLDAQTLKPASNVIVGIYSSDDDTLFTTTPFERIAKTNEAGRFSIKGVSNKQYHIYALEDLNSNYFYDQKGEGLAMQEAVPAIPTLHTSFHNDTIYKDSVTIDTIIVKKKITYSPDSLCLRLFHREVKFQAFDKIVRDDRKYFTLYFRKCEKSLPKLSPINFDAKDWYICEANEETDTLKYWITDTTVLKLDTINFALEYLKTDSAEQLVPQFDTLSATLSANYLKTETKKLKSEEAINKRYEKKGLIRKRQNILSLQKSDNTIEINEVPVVKWDNPISHYKKEGIHLKQQKDAKDSIGTDISFQLEMKDDNRTFKVKADIKPDLSYNLVIDSASVYDYYGNFNNKISMNFSMKNEDLYGSIQLNITNISGEVYVQLLNSGESVVRQEKLKDGKVVYPQLTPGVYFVKLFVDKNSNGVWDTGNYEQKLQPENVYYFNKSLKLRKGWSMEEDWNVTSTPLERQRPSGFTNKSKQVKTR